VWEISGGGMDSIGRVGRGEVNVGEKVKKIVGVGGVGNRYGE